MMPVVDPGPAMYVLRGVSWASSLTRFVWLTLRRYVDVQGEQIRKDNTEGQAGIKLTLVIQVVDYKTCKVVPEAYVDIWSSNATVSTPPWNPERQD